MGEEIQVGIEAAKQWPVLLQAVLGSALFSLISYLGQILYKSIVGKLSLYNASLRNENLYRELFQKKLIRTSDRSGKVTLTLMYQGFACLLRGMMFFLIGYLFESIIPLSSIIGTIGLIYYLFKAMLWVEPLWIEPKISNMQVWQRVYEIEIALFGEAKKDTLEKLKELS